MKITKIIGGGYMATANVGTISLTKFAPTRLGALRLLIGEIGEVLDLQRIPDQVILRG